MKIGSVSFFLGLSVVGVASDKVIDLGKLQIEGKFRGPDFSLIESNLLHAKSAESMGLQLLKSYEVKLLEADPMPTILEFKKSENARE